MIKKFKGEKEGKKERKSGDVHDGARKKKTKEKRKKKKQRK